MISLIDDGNSETILPEEAVSITVVKHEKLSWVFS